MAATPYDPTGEYQWESMPGRRACWQHCNRSRKVFVNNVGYLLSLFND